MVCLGRLLCWSPSPHPQFLWLCSKGRVWEETWEKINKIRHWSHFQNFHYINTDKMTRYKILVVCNACVCFGGGCSLTISLGGCVANLLRWKGKAATLISIHITPHLLNHTHTHTHHPRKKSKSPYLAGYSTAWWRSETWYTWTNRDLISHRLPPEEAWQRLKKLYIPPSVTGQQGQTPHLSLAVILLSNTSHRPQSIGGKLASLLFSNKKTPRKFSLYSIYQDLVYTRG